MYVDSVKSDRTVTPKSRQEESTGDTGLSSTVDRNSDIGSGLTNIQNVTFINRNRQLPNLCTGHQWHLCYSITPKRKGGDPKPTYILTQSHPGMVISTLNIFNKS